MKIIPRLTQVIREPEAGQDQARGAAAGSPVLPRATDDALRLVGQLGPGMTNRSSLTLLFCAVTAHCRASRLVYETGLAIFHMLGAPVLLVDLRERDGDLGAVYTRSIRAKPLDGYPPWSVEGVPSFAVARLREPHEDLTAMVGSGQFVSFLEWARRQFSYILLDTGPVADSAVGLLAARFCESVVLCVRPGLSTFTEVQDTQAAFVRAQTNVMGFIFDEVA